MFSVRLSETERGLVARIAAQMERTESDAMRHVIREAARSRGIQSALQLSERSGVNKNSVTSFWNGSALRIDRDSLGKLCHTLQCTPGDLLVFVRRSGDEERS